LPRAWRRCRPDNEPNRNRIGPAQVHQNFGILEVDWAAAAGPTLRMTVRDPPAITDPVLSFFGPETPHVSY
jgi:hypothetical protein